MECPGTKCPEVQAVGARVGRAAASGSKIVAGVHALARQGRASDVRRCQIRVHAAVRCYLLAISCAPPVSATTCAQHIAMVDPCKTQPDTLEGLLHSQVQNLRTAHRSRLGRMYGHIAVRETECHRVAAQLGRPLAEIPKSSRDTCAKEWGTPFWMDVEAHGVTKPRFPKLAADKDVDVLVVGAGIVGLKMAHHASKMGLSVLVAEGSAIGHQAASARTEGGVQ